MPQIFLKSGQVHGGITLENFEHLLADEFKWDLPSLERTPQEPIWVAQELIHEKARTAHALAKRGKYRESVEVYKKALKLNTEWPEAATNLAWIFGYIRSSWTLRSDLIGHFVCRLLQHMDELGMRQVTPRLRPEDEGMAGKAFIDPDDFAPGYIRRGTHRLPKQSDQGPWVNPQNYYEEKDVIPETGFDDGALVFGNPDPSKTEAA